MAATRFNLGPFTMPFTPDPTCATPMAGQCSLAPCYAYQGQACTRLPKFSHSYGLADQSSCWPPYTQGAATVDVASKASLGGWGFYSPGITCPAGQTPACTKTAGRPDGFTFRYPPTDGETAAGCCPTSYTCDHDKNNIQTCVRTLRSTLYEIVSCGGTDAVGTAVSTLVATASEFHILLAPMIQINWQPSDLPVTSTQQSSSLSTGPITIDSVPEPTSSPAPAPAQEGLSAGARVGVGVGASLAGLILLGVTGYLTLLRKRKSPVAPYAGPPPTEAENAGYQLDSNNMYEIGGSRQVMENYELFAHSQNEGYIIGERQELD